MASIYFQGTHFISNTDEVRRLARNVITADFSQEQIESYQYKVYSIIQTDTNKTDWDSGDVEYGALQLIETIVAANLIKMHYGDGSSESVLSAQTQIDAAYKDLTDIIDNLDTTISASTNKIRKTSYKSWILNTEVPVPRRGLTIT